MKKLLFIFSLLFSAATMNAWEVWFSNSEKNWEEVYVYTWHRSGGHWDTTVGPAWPGTKMTNIGDNIWYFEGEGDPTHIIFNNGHGSQTSDLEYNQGFYNATGLFTFTKDNVKYYISNYKLNYAGVLSVTNKAASSVKLPSSVNLLGEDCLITDIANYAFSDSEYLENIELPASLVNIGNYSFQNCQQLNSVVIPNTVVSIGRAAFYGCYDLSNVEIGNSVTTLPTSVFENCIGIKNIVIPNSVVSIGDSAFSGCESLADIVIPNSVVSIGSSAFSECESLADIVIPNSVISIGSYAFSKCESLASIVIPNSVVSIGSSAFSECRGLTSVEIGEGIEDFGYQIFSMCPIESAVLKCKVVPGSFFSDYSSLTNVTFGESVETIGSSAFYNCDSLTEIDIPDSVTKIGNSAFESCDGLTTIVLGEKVEDIGTSVFRFCPIETAVLKCKVVPNSFFSNYSSLRNVTFGESVETIGESAFYYCKGLSEVVIPDAVTTIMEKAFYGCDGLVDVKLGNSVKTIGESAFYNCIGLTEMVVPDAVTSIMGKAFYGCDGLVNVKLGNSVKTIGESAFYNCIGLTEMVIPDAVVTIGASAFAECKGLVKVELGSSIETIENSVFSNCTDLSEMFIPDSVVSIISGAFKGCSSLVNLKLGNSLERIGPSAFEGCSGLTNIEFPPTLVSIGDNAFKDCSGMLCFILPVSVSSIGRDAFKGCTSLIKNAYPENLSNPFSNGVSIPYPNETIIENGFIYSENLDALYFAPFDLEGEFIIPQYVVTVGKSAFQVCNKLTTIEVPNSVMEIGDKAFYDCEGLLNINVNWNIPVSITQNCFSKDTYSNALLNVSEGNWIDYLLSPWEAFNNIQIDGVVMDSIDDGTFTYRYLQNSGEAMLVKDSKYSNLSTVTIPDRVVSDGQFYFVIAVQNNAFIDCTRISGDLVLPRNLRQIGESAFEGCYGIASVNIPASLETIGANAFNKCSSLEKVNITDLTAWCKITFQGYSSANPLSLAKHLYLNEEEIVDLVIPEGIEKLNFAVFYNGVSIKSISIPLSVKSIADYAFSNTGISEIRIPSSVEKYSGFATAHCSSLNTVTFDQNSEPLNILHGNLFSDEKIKTLIIERDFNFDKEKSAIGIKTIEQVNYGDGVSCINDNLFTGNSNLSEIVIPSSVEYIGESAFEGTGLKTIAIGAGIVEIGDKAFKGCNPSDIYITALESPMAFNTTFSNISGKLYVTPDCEENYYNNPNCWYQFNYPTSLVVATGLQVDSSEDSEGNVKLVGTVEPDDATLPYVMWKSADVNAGVIDPDGTVHFYNDAQECSFIASTLYADGPVLIVTVESDGNITDVEVGDAGVESVVDDFKGSFAVYTIQGIRVMNTNNFEDLKLLSKGIYIINGKKVMIK